MWHLRSILSSAESTQTPIHSYTKFMYLKHLETGETGILINTKYLKTGETGILINI
jgi:hypothetical protein